MRAKRSVRHNKRRTDTKPAAALPPPVAAGFPEFWQVAYDNQKKRFEVLADLESLVNDALGKPVTGKLGKVEHFMTGIVANSLGALITLVLNGYGHDAMRVARGMYEAAVNAAYLKSHPDSVEDYLDYAWVVQKKRLDYLREQVPSGFTRLSPETVTEVEARFLVVQGRFADGKGKPRNSWSKKSLRDRANEVGLGNLYPSFYAHASGIHHADISGLTSQTTKGHFSVDLAPSLALIEDALIMGHSAVLHTLDSLNSANEMEMDLKIGEARDAFVRVWEAA